MTSYIPKNNWKRIAESWRRFGQTRPVLARTANRMLIAGHGVRAGMKLAGATEIDVLLWDVDQYTADAYLEADNRTGELAQIDQQKRRELVLGFADEDLPALGWMPDEVADLLSSAPDPLVVREIEVGDVEDTFWIRYSGADGTN